MSGAQSVMLCRGPSEEWKGEWDWGTVVGLGAGGLLSREGFTK